MVITKAMQKQIVIHSVVDILNAMESSNATIAKAE
jgi:hypothetical protein